MTLPARLRRIRNEGQKRALPQSKIGRSHGFQMKEDPDADQKCKQQEEKDQTLV
jgi:hypothetical protein